MSFKKTESGSGEGMNTEFEELRMMTREPFPDDQPSYGKRQKNEQKRKENFEMVNEQETDTIYCPKPKRRIYVNQILSAVT